jgi:small subunit ribosomal protein S20
LYNGSLIKEELNLANTKSAIKEIRVARARQERNKSNISEIKSAVRKAGEAVKADDKSTAQATMRATQSRLDKSVGKTNMHANAAARTQSRLTRRMNKATAPKAA